MWIKLQGLIAISIQMSLLLTWLKSSRVQAKSKPLCHLGAQGMAGMGQMKPKLMTTTRINMWLIGSRQSRLFHTCTHLHNIMYCICMLHTSSYIYVYQVNDVIWCHVYIPVIQYVESSIYICMIIRTPVEDDFVWFSSKISPFRDLFLENGDFSASHGWLSH